MKFAVIPFLSDVRTNTSSTNTYKYSMESNLHIPIYDSIPKEYEKLRIRRDESDKCKEVITEKPKLGNEIIKLPTKRKEPSSKFKILKTTNEHGTKYLINPNKSNSNKLITPTIFRSSKTLEMSNNSKTNLLNDRKMITIFNKNHSENCNLPTNLSSDKSKRIETFKQLGSVLSREYNFKFFANTQNIFATRIGKKYQIDFIPKLQKFGENANSIKRAPPQEIWNPNILTDLEGKK